MQAKWAATLTVLTTVAGCPAAAATAFDALVVIAGLETSRNYSWESTMPGAPGSPTTVEGQTEQGGFTVVRRTSPGSSITAVGRDDRNVTETPYGWLTPEQLRVRGNPRSPLDVRTPVQDMQDMIAACHHLRITRAEISGTFDAGTAVEFWMARHELFGGKRLGVQELNGRDFSGGFHIWLRAGVVTGYDLYFEFTPDQGCFPPPGPSRRATVLIPTYILAVNSTTITVPDDARVALK
jgi:hypothetical protein